MLRGEEIREEGKVLKVRAAIELAKVWERVLHNKE
jgi:hypothetical protein